MDRIKSRYLRISNWDAHQVDARYKGALPWIKLFTKTLKSRRLMILPEITQAHFIKILLAAADVSAEEPHGYLKFDPEDIAFRIHTTERIDFIALKDAGLIDFTDNIPSVPKESQEIPSAPTESPLERESKRERESKGRGKKELPPPTPSEFQNRWNVLVKNSVISACRAMGPDRERNLKARRREDLFAANWEAAIGRMTRSKFLCGESGKGWKASADWFLKAGNVTKIIEGKFDNPSRDLSAKPPEGSKDEPF